MIEQKRKRSGNSILRAAFVAVSFLLQLGWILLQILALNRYSAWISGLTHLVAVLAVLKLCAKQNNGAYKLSWIMLIMAMPIMGLSLFLLTQASVSQRSMRRRMTRMKERNAPFLTSDAGEDSLSQYLRRWEGMPAWGNTSTKYFGETLDALEAMKEDLRKAEKFIFMEYFILEEGEAFGQIREILEEKAAQGVEVRLMYDDLGSIGKSSFRYALELSKSGIHCQVFNPALPFLNLFLNNRDHRKITVIDGKVGYTGGYNLADEYFHYTKPYGYWKDTGVRLEGEAVRNLTAAFLELWNVNARTEEDPAPYLDISHRVEAPGLVQPFGDSPLDDQRTAEDVFLMLLGRAKKSVWFMTPYLIITDELSRGLELAAKRGIDVRIITPGIPDKRTVYALTRSYYGPLLKEGVKIYEYSPGFCHGKLCLCDGELAVIGTSNLDYRSLYHHFENNVLLMGTDAVTQMEADFQAMFPQCRQVTERGKAPLRTWQCILRLFAPLM